MNIQRGGTKQLAISVSAAIECKLSVKQSREMRYIINRIDVAGVVISSQTSECQ
jgi:hypothetical protein